MGHKKGTNSKPVAKSLSMEEMANALANEKMQRAARCHERIQKILNEEQCDFRVISAFTEAGTLHNTVTVNPR